MYGISFTQPMNKKEARLAVLEFLGVSRLPAGTEIF
jgi:hypothetical protein